MKARTQLQPQPRSSGTAAQPARRDADRPGCTQTPFLSPFSHFSEERKLHVGL